MIFLASDPTDETRQGIQSHFQATLDQLEQLYDGLQLHYGNETIGKKEMDIAVKNTIKQAMKNVKFVHQQYIPKALVTALNKVGAEVATQAKKRISGSNWT